ncbi:hypothetical protein [Desulforegula conservatrix]|uniref:hypothetical protein n=1 Tax=Desulforegula conservatrix TaxID=153026 RepID=UPI0003FC9408|nr:hypothetical protein [Desulforegula conservatrix]
MEPLKYMKQIVNYNRTAHENLYGAYSRFTEETEKAALGIVEKMGFAFGGNNEVFHEVSNLLKKGRENYKKAVDEGFVKVESYIKAV